jgi:hypothetical protein
MASKRNPKDRPDRNCGASEPGHMPEQKIQRDPSTTAGYLKKSPVRVGENSSNESQKDDDKDVSPKRGPDH